jgi:outer membrane protein assembly factor BamB
LEETGNRIFVNVPDKKEIEVIDGTQLTVLVRWPVTSAQGNFPMALDEAHHRLFVGTWTPSRMLVLDTETGQEIASGEISGPSDDLFYDSRRGRVYVLASAGFLEVFQDKDHNQYDRIAHYPTPPHTQTGLFVPEWGRLFAAAQRQGEQSAEIRVYDTN